MARYNQSIRKQDMPLYAALPAKLDMINADRDRQRQQQIESELGAYANMGLVFDPNERDMQLATQIQGEFDQGLNEWDDAVAKGDWEEAADKLKSMRRQYGQYMSAMGTTPTGGTATTGRTSGGERLDTHVGQLAYNRKATDTFRKKLNEAELDPVDIFRNNRKYQMWAQQGTLDENGNFRPFNATVDETEGDDFWLEAALAQTDKIKADKTSWRNLSDGFKSIGEREYIDGDKAGRVMNSMVTQFVNDTEFIERYGSEYEMLLNEDRIPTDDDGNPLIGQGEYIHNKANNLVRTAVVKQIHSQVSEKGLSKNDYDFERWKLNYEKQANRPDYVEMTLNGVDLSQGTEDIVTDLRDYLRWDETQSVIESSLSEGSGTRGVFSMGSSAKSISSIVADIFKKVNKPKGEILDRVNRIAEITNNVEYNETTGKYINKSTNKEVPITEIFEGVADYLENTGSYLANTKATNIHEVNGWNFGKLGEGSEGLINLLFGGTDQGIGEGTGIVRGALCIDDGKQYTRKELQDEIIKSGSSDEKATSINSPMIVSGQNPYIPLLEEEKFGENIKSRNFFVVVTINGKQYMVGADVNKMIVPDGKGGEVDIVNENKFDYNNLRTTMRGGEPIDFDYEGMRLESRLIKKNGMGLFQLSTSTDDGSTINGIGTDTRNAYNNMVLSVSAQSIESNLQEGKAQEVDLSRFGINEYVTITKMGNNQYKIQEEEGDPVIFKSIPRYIANRVDNPTLTLTTKANTPDQEE